MNYQNKQLPAGAVYSATTPMMNQHTVLKPMLERHMAPRGKCGMLSVSEGSLKFVWDDTGETFTADPGHPVIVEPERYHHLEITGPVSFRVVFYRVPVTGKADQRAIRPGEEFIRA